MKPAKPPHSNSPKSLRGRNDHGETSAAAGSVRIIAGKWRGTRLPVAAVEGLRPSSDRVRETLFNWLQFDIHGLRVLDAFAGTGALGFEAASRGAADVLLIERDPRACAALQANCARLGAERVAVQQADVLSWLSAHPEQQFDLAFVDPPFAAGLHRRTLDTLVAHMRANSWIYVEQPVTDALPSLPGWVCYREGMTRDVRYVLLKHLGPSA